MAGPHFDVEDSDEEGDDEDGCIVEDDSSDAARGAGASGAEICTVPLPHLLGSIVGTLGCARARALLRPLQAE